MSVNYGYLEFLDVEHGGISFKAARFKDLCQENTVNHVLMFIIDLKVKHRSIARLL